MNSMVSNKGTETFDSSDENPSLVMWWTNTQKQKCVVIIPSFLHYSAVSVCIDKDV